MLPCSEEKAIDPGLCFIYKKRFSGEKTEDMKYSKYEANGFISKKKQPFEEK